MQQRISRFSGKTGDAGIRDTHRAMATLRLFDHARILPFNYMHALVPDGGSYDGHRRQCTRMVRAGVLDAFTFNGSKNTSETMTFYRTNCGRRISTNPQGTCCGDHFMHVRGFDGLPHDGTHDAHQVLLDIADAQIELGLRGTDVELHRWPDILNHPKTPPQPAKPFRFELSGNRTLIPDGRPFFLKRRGFSQLFLKELDRNNENPKVIMDKLRNYRAAEAQIKRRYGFAGFMVLFITTDATRLLNILRWTNEVLGPCKWILVGFIDDHVKHKRPTPILTTDLVDVPFQRNGNPPFSLKTLTEA